MNFQRATLDGYYKTLPWLLFLVAFSATPATARQISDFTNDPVTTSLIAPNTSPSMTDVFDLMVWNTTKFTVLSGLDNGDANADGVIDVSDFNIWNSNKFTHDNSGTCDPASTSCASDSDYFSRLTSPPYGWSSVGGASPFSATSGATDSLFVNLPAGTILQNFTVQTPNAATPGTFGTDFGGPFFQNTSGGSAGADTFYFNGRQQWYTVEITAPGGWDSANNGLVAEFPAGSLSSAPIVYQLLTGVGVDPRPESEPTLTTYFASDLDGVAIGLMVPEPSTTALVLPLILSLAASRSRRIRNSA